MASGAVIHTTFAFKQQNCHLQPHPPLEQKNGVKAPEGKFVLLLFDVKGEKSGVGSLSFWSMYKVLNSGMDEWKPLMFGNKDK